MKKNQTLKEYTKEQAAKLAKAFIDIQAKEVKGDGTFEVIASTEGVDRDGEIILVKGWDTKNFELNPVILFGHDYRSFPIGAATEIIKEEDKLIVKGIFANTDEGQKARQLYDDGILKTVSVGFIPLTREGNVITSAELLELSFVPVPANPEALSLAKDLSNMLKTVVPFKETSKAPEDQTWDPKEAINNVKGISSNEEGIVDFDKYKSAFAYYNSEDAGKTSSYSLVHHNTAGDSLQVVWRGVMDSMAQLLSGQSNVPDDQKQGVYNHLKKHYTQFEKEAPELKEYTEVQLKEAFPHLAEAEEATKEIKEVVDSILNRLEDDVKNLVNSAAMQVEELMGDLKNGAKSTPLHGEKAGRTLSAKTRTAIKNAADSTEKAAKDLTALLKVADGEADPKEADDALLKLFQTIDKIAETGIKAVKSV